MGIVGWSIVLGVLVIVYARMTSNKSLIDTNKMFTHADVTTGYTTTTYKILKYDYISKDHLSQIKIWPDRSENPDWPEFIQASTGAVKLYSK